MIKHFCLTTLSKALNAYLALDTESKTRLKRLEGNVITIEFLPLHLVFQCFFKEQQVEIKSGDAFPAATKISGTPLTMVGMMISKENRHRFFADDMKIEGNAELGQLVISLFDELHIDWQEPLSRLIGDVPVYHSARLIKTVGDWFSQTENAFSQNMNEYIHEEKEWLPSKEALEDFYSAVDLLRMDIDRAEARLKYLQASIESKE